MYCELHTSNTMANAYGSVPHWLIKETFKQRHAPQHLQMVVENLYSDLQVMVTTKRWSTSLLPCKIGMFQGDPFTVVVFNTVINTLAIQLKQVTPALGYKLNRSDYVIDAHLFADDVTLPSKDLQKLCDSVQMVSMVNASHQRAKM